MKTNEDIELMLFRLKEGMLSDKEVAEAHEFLLRHPEWQEVADLYDPQLSVPSYPIVSFADKESLRKPIKTIASQRKAVIWRRLSVAASILVAVSIALWMLLVPETDEGYTLVVAENQMKETASEPNPNEDGKTEADEAIDVYSMTPSHNEINDVHSGQSVVEQPVIGQPVVERAAAARVTMTDKLIVYLDDAEAEQPATPFVEETDRMITYLPADTPASVPAETTPRPAWTYSVEDWWNGIQLAYTERQNIIIDRFTNKN